MATETPASLATSFIVAMVNIPVGKRLHKLSVTEKARYFKVATLAIVANLPKTRGVLVSALHYAGPGGQVARKE
ncbi:hypothetical protein EHN07_11095 [Buttiauxella warmboldiae]|uniref:Uncharacterized protein n=1 Tax=Buttiauxella warmboldiae TaxID=82993 RepID=A0A3N5DNR9_9ENTR|nr:hypothetical protein EHN07_11095 [Buttiauxella warmboldiae]